MNGMAETQCKTICVDAKTFAAIRKRLSGQDVTGEVAEMFKALADPVRIRIIEALALKDLCVFDLSQLLSLSQSATSHQLRTLRQSRIVKNRKEGKTVIYSLDDRHVADLVAAVFSHVSHGK